MIPFETRKIIEKENEILGPGLFDSYFLKPFYVIKNKKNKEKSVSSFFF